MDGVGLDGTSPPRTGRQAENSPPLGS